MNNDDFDLSNQTQDMKKLWIECKEKAQGDKLFAIEMLMKIIREKEKEEVYRNEMQVF